MLPHTRFALTAEEKAEGLILACRAQLLTSIEVAWIGKENEVAHGSKTDIAAPDETTPPNTPEPPFPDAARRPSEKTAL